MTTVLFHRFHIVAVAAVGLGLATEICGRIISVTVVECLRWCVMAAAVLLCCKLLGCTIKSVPQSNRAAVVCVCVYFFFALVAVSLSNWSNQYTQHTDRQTYKQRDRQTGTSIRGSQTRGTAREISKLAWARIQRQTFRLPNLSEAPRADVHHLVGGTGGSQLIGGLFSPSAVLPTNHGREGNQSKGK